MKRAERLNDLLLWLDGRNSFLLRDLCDRYSVSRSTALRDVGALQELGVPPIIWSQLGNGGGYRVLPNRLLPPVSLLP